MARGGCSTSNHFYSTSIPTNGGPMTFIGYGYWDTGASDIIMNWGRTGGNTVNRYLALHSNAKCNVFSRDNTGTNVGVYTSNTATSGYHLIGGTDDGSGNLSAFLDGSSGKGTNSSAPTGSFSQVNRFHVGCRYVNGTASLPWSNIMNWCAIWNVVLNDDEIDYLASGVIDPIVIRPNSLTFLTRFKRPSGTDEYDLIGERTLTENGTVGAPASTPHFEREGVIVVSTVSAATTQTLTTSVQSAIQAQQTLQASLNSAVSAEQTAQLSIDGAVAALMSAVANINTAVEAQDGTLAASINSAIQGQDNTLAASLNSAVQQEQTATLSIDGYVTALQSVLTNINTAVAALQSADFTVDAGIQEAQSSSVSLTGALAALQSSTATLQAAISEARTAAASLNGFVQASATAETITLDAAITEAQTLAASLNAAVAAAQSLSFDLNAFISVANSLTTDISGYITAPQAVAALLDAAIQAAASAAASISAGISEQQSAAVAVSTAIAVTQTLTTAADVAIAATGSSIVSIGAAVEASITAGLSVNARIFALGEFEPGASRTHAPTTARNRRNTLSARNRRH